MKHDVTERPILFNGQMVPPVLADRKTQTRRVVKPQPEMVSDRRIETWNGDPDSLMRLLHKSGRKCPYGKPGDRLWVREAWKAHPTFDHLPPREIPHSPVWYMADDGYKAESRFRQGMFMPRWASRITLEITDVRVERLQDISRGDAMAEGCPFPNMAAGPDPRQWYAELWNQINGPSSWDFNPWVWCVTFKRIKP